jgi:hypothetical protein
MNTKADVPPTESHPSVLAGILKRTATVAIFFVLIAAILFLAAGRLNWIWAWVYLGISLVSVLINAPIMLRTSPETIAERGELKMTENWDKVVSGFYALAMYFALPLVAGLDVRFGWARDPSVASHAGRCANPTAHRSRANRAHLRDVRASQLLASGSGFLYSQGRFPSQGGAEGTGHEEQATLLRTQGAERIPIDRVSPTRDRPGDPTLPDRPREIVATERPIPEGVWSPLLRLH